MKYGYKTPKEDSELSLNGYIVSQNGIRLSRGRLSDIRHVISSSKINHSKRETDDDSKFLEIMNGIKLKHRDLSKFPFKTVAKLIQYLCGYRSYLISWVDYDFPKTSFQRELVHLISRIEKEIIILNE
ncbi:MAG TPA: hypothetical protein PLA74_08545 [Syntrophales bacterium]|nr:hypothetical protein [Syntrophales bacterium]HRX08810.1 hypothetical protein [Candidatus Limiplasma sp.]